MNLRQARKFSAKARKFWTKAKKFSAKFNVFRSKRVKPERGRDVNASLQVKTDCLHNLSSFDHDLQNRDRVKLVD